MYSLCDRKPREKQCTAYGLSNTNHLGPFLTTGPCASCNTELKSTAQSRPLQLSGGPWVKTGDALFILHMEINITSLTILSYINVPATRYAISISWAPILAFVVELEGQCNVSRSPSCRSYPLLLPAVPAFHLDFQPLMFPLGAA